MWVTYPCSACYELALSESVESISWLCWTGACLALGSVFNVCVCVRVEQDLPIKALTTNKVDRTQVNQNLDRTPSYSPSPTAGMTCGVGKFKICNYTFYVYRL